MKASKVFKGCVAKRFPAPGQAPVVPKTCLHVVQDGQAVGAMQADKLLLGTEPWTVMVMSTPDE